MGQVRLGRECSHESHGSRDQEHRRSLTGLDRGMLLTPFPSLRDGLKARAAVRRAPCGSRASRTGPFRPTQPFGTPYECDGDQARRRYGAVPPAGRHSTGLDVQPPDASPCAPCRSSAPRTRVPSRAASCPHARVHAWGSRRRGPAEGSRRRGAVEEPRACPAMVSKGSSTTRARATRQRTLPPGQMYL